MKSDVTKKYKRLYITFTVLSVLILVTPILVYTVIGFINGEIQQKLTLGLTVSAALLLTLVNVIFKYHIRSSIWIVTLGIYFCIENIMPLLLMVAIGTMLDEFILSPLSRTYKQKAGINAEIDKRILNKGED